MRVEKKGDFGRRTESGCANCEEAQEADEGSKNDAEILVGGPLKEAESGGPELDPKGPHLGCRGVGAGGGITACADLGRPGSGIPGMREQRCCRCVLCSLLAPACSPSGY